MNKNHLVESKSKSWTVILSEFLDQEINTFINEYGQCNFFLTGGRSAKLFYENWFKSIQNKNIIFYFGDERCLDNKNPDTNSSLVESAFRKANITDYRLNSIHTDSGQFEDSARKYSGILPGRFDIILLSLGDDGHVASLFPNSKALQSTECGYIYTQGPPPFKDRISITAPLINQFQCKVVLVIGKMKGMAFRNTYKLSSTPADYPLLLLNDLIFIFDQEAYEYIHS